MFSGCSFFGDGAGVVVVDGRGTVGVLKRKGVVRVCLEVSFGFGGFDRFSLVSKGFVRLWDLSFFFWIV